MFLIARQGSWRPSGEYFRESGCLTVGLLALAVTFIAFFFHLHHKLLYTEVIQSTSRVNMHVFYPQSYARPLVEDSDGSCGWRASTWKEDNLSCSWRERWCCLVSGWWQTEPEGIKKELKLYLYILLKLCILLVKPLQKFPFPSPCCLHFLWAANLAASSQSFCSFIPLYYSLSQS